MSFVTQGSIPEVVERFPGASIEDRTAILPQVNDLGPPDLVNLIKIIGQPTPKSTPQSLQTTGVYLYYTGADTSNVATVAALLNSLATIIGEEPQMWFGKRKPWHVSHATYSTYNAFRKMDIRVHVAFPGSVKWEVLDQYGNHASSDIIGNEESDDIWTECFVSSMVRSLITAEDDGDFASIVEIRRINPFMNPKVSIPEFLNGFKKLYIQGEKLGCNEFVHAPSRLDNYLVDAFFNCVELTHCYEQALEILYSLVDENPEVSVLIARTLFLANREIEAVKYIHEKLAASPNIFEVPGASHLLLLQSKFCFDKQRPDLALPLAVKAVESSPSLFEPWEHLAKVYIALNKFEDALLTLNACPMVTHKDKYILKRIASGAAERLKEQSERDSTQQISSSSPRPSDMHLPLPSDVFLSGVTNLSSVDVAAEHAKLSKTSKSDNDNSITPSSILSLPASTLKSTFKRSYLLLAQIVHKIGWENMLKMRSKVFVMEEEWHLSNPSMAKLSSHSATDLSGDFRKKRLCERWLDNLFMLLYEDMKVYTFVRAQEMQAESMSDTLTPPLDSGSWCGSPNAEKTLDPYTESRTCIEWELIGLICERLGHKRDAQRCYERALARRFSVRAGKKLIGIYSRWRNRTRQQIGAQGKISNSITLGNGNNSKIMNNANNSMATLTKSVSHSYPSKDFTMYDPALLRLSVGLLVWDYRWYTLFSPLLLDTLAEVFNDIGSTKAESEVRIWFDKHEGNRGVLDLVNLATTILESWGRVETEH